MTDIGILSTGMYVPETFMTAEEMAGLTNISQEIIEEKLGIKQKPIPGEDDHTCYMGIQAAKKAISKAGLAPEKIDVVIYIGEEHKEYPVWTAAIKLQEEIGAVNAWAFDCSLRCSTTIMALKLAKSLMADDPSINTICLAGGYRNGDLISYSNPRTRFMYNLAAGGGAIILQRELGKNRLLSTTIKTDGAFSEDVIVPAGGTKCPASAETLKEQLHYLDVPDPAGMKQRLEKKSMENFLYVIRKALSDSGYTEEDIDYLAVLHMKRSAHEHLLKELGLNHPQSIYLEEYGHIGQFDQILSIELALEENRIKEGDVVVMVSAGIGYAWSASVIKWG